MKIRKLSINVLCAMIIVTLGVSLLMPIYKLGYNFGAGVRMGYEHQEMIASGDKSTPLNTRTVDVYFEPDPSTYFETRDSISFHGGAKYPVTYTRGVIAVDENSGKIPGWIPVLQGICIVAQGVFFILMLIQFVKFVININKGRIFVSDNVRRLRRIAMWLILLSVFCLCCGIAEEIAVSNLNLTLEGYGISAYWSIPWEVFIMGLVSLLISEAWDRGLKMQEEQDFTV